MVPDHDEDMEQVEANGRNNEQIYGGNVRRVIPQEGAPSLARRSTQLNLDDLDRATGLLGRKKIGYILGRSCRDPRSRIA